MPIDKDMPLTEQMKFDLEAENFLMTSMSSSLQAIATALLVLMVQVNQPNLRF